MIGRLRGLLAAKTGGEVVIDTAGIGYEVMVTPRGLAELPAVGEEAVLHTHLVVREDVLALYGFADEAERDVFRVLVAVPGVGPKLALAICATLSPEELQRAVAAGDSAALELVPGIGRKTAQKLLLELQSRLDVPALAAGKESSSALAEVRSALEGLGYEPVEIRTAVAELPADGEVGSLLRAALQTLGSSE